MRVNLNTGLPRQSFSRDVWRPTFDRMIVVSRMLAIGMATCGRPVAAAQGDGDGKVTISGELKQWHKVTLTQDGPLARETDSRPNPFTDYRMTVTWADVEDGSMLKEEDVLSDGTPLGLASPDFAGDMALRIVHE